LTMGCARCHSHKYDPITHKEFYQFYAFFNNVPEKGLDGRTGNAAPLMLLPSHDEEQRLEEIDAKIEARELAVADERIAPLQAQWEQTVTSRATPIEAAGLAAHYELDGNFSDISGKYQHGTTVTGDPTFEEGPVGRAATFDGDTEVSFGNVGAFDRAEPFSLAVWLNGFGKQPMAVLQKMEKGQAGRGYSVRFDDVELIGIQRWAAKLKVALTSDSPVGGVEIRSRERFRLGAWHHVAVTYDGGGKAAGLKLYVNGLRADADVVRDDLAGPIRTNAALRAGNPDEQKAFNGQLDDLRLYYRALTADQVKQVAVHEPARVILSGVLGKRSTAQAQRIRDYFLTHAAPPAARTQYAELKALRIEKQEFEKLIPSAMVMTELDKPRETFVLARGDYRNRTDKVEPGVPAMLPPLPKDAPLNRLTLAKWLVDPAHPLTSRVAVNRFWQSYFGYGIVKTQEDFGVQGEPPINPELLDWLSTEFVRTGWDVRALQRLIVTSSTYRQSSAVTEELLERDPENRLLARGPRMRLPAEMIRDTALAVSGLLNDEIGGPSVLPYQPKGLWEEMAFGDGFSAQEYEQSHGKDLYRRGMYTFWKRTVPPASMATFDAPDREKCAARRAMTNTPLQALVLMNDPAYVEAARALAQRVLREGGKDDKSRIAYTFRLATARTPTGKESGVLRALLSKERAGFARDPKAAAALLTVGESKRDASLDAVELAAWTTVASAVLNLDETITKQ
jgi:Protein of unknown function (DUF1553)/Concanavalin A-like lectin/glucanases superfamily/Protein of unknown function (DUF1549)